MVRRNLPKSRTNPLGEYLVDGLLQGMAAGLIALVILLFVAGVAGFSPLDLLSAFGVRGRTDPGQGLLSHLAMSAIYGMLWALLVSLFVRRVDFPWRQIGLFYGLVLWGFGEMLFINSTGLGAYPWFWIMIAHLIYGGTLAMLQERQRHSRR